MRAIDHIEIKLIVISLIVIILINLGCSSDKKNTKDRNFNTSISQTEITGKKIPINDFRRCTYPKCDQPEKPCSHCKDLQSKFNEEHKGKSNPFKPHDIVIKYDTLTCEMIRNELNKLEQEYTKKLLVAPGELSEEDLLDYKIDSIILSKINSLQEGIETEQLCLDDSTINWLIDRTLYEYLDSTLRANDILSENYSYKESIKQSNLKKCLCGEDLYLYHNPLIQMEGTIVQASTESVSEGEGGGALNYIIQPEGDYPNKFARNLTKNQKGSLYCNGRSSLNLNNNGINCNTILTNQVSYTGPVVAFLDSGIDPQLFTHNKYYYSNISCPQIPTDVKGWNFVDENNITHDDVGHGTLVAAAFKYKMADLRYNEYSVLPVKVLDSCGYGTLFTTVCGLYYAKEKKADLVNCSWGLYINEEIMEDAINELAQDAVIVTSAGNKGFNLGQNEHYPSEYSWLNDNAIASFNRIYEVAGLCHNYNSITHRNSFKYWDKSNFNTINYSESAIGYEDLINGIPSNLKSRENNCTCNGTSYAAPMFAAHVARRFPFGDMKTNPISTLNLNRCTMTPVTKTLFRNAEE